MRDEIRDVKTLLVSGSDETNETRLEDVVKEIKDEFKKIKNEIRDVKKTIITGCKETNDTRMEEVAEEIKAEISDEIRVVKTLLVSGSGVTNETRLEDVVNEIKDVKKLLTSNPTDCVTTEPSKQALVSALVCEYLVCFQFDNTGSMEITHAMLL